MKTTPGRIAFVFAVAMALLTAVFGNVVVLAWQQNAGRHADPVFQDGLLALAVVPIITGAIALFALMFLVVAESGDE